MEKGVTGAWGPRGPGRSVWKGVPGAGSVGEGPDQVPWREVGEEMLIEGTGISKERSEKLRAAPTVWR